MSIQAITLYSVATIIFVVCCIFAIINLPVKLLVDIISSTTLTIIAGLICEFIYNVVINKWN